MQHKVIYAVRKGRLYKFVGESVASNMISIYHWEVSLECEPHDGHLRLFERFITQTYSHPHKSEKRDATDLFRQHDIFARLNNFINDPLVRTRILNGYNFDYII